MTSRPGIAFGAAAQNYDQAAVIQRRVARDLARLIADSAFPKAPRILEIGCGTGFLGQALAPSFPDARWIFSDLAPAMLSRCRANPAIPHNASFIAMDGEAPCFPRAAQFDLICSSLAVQWFAQPETSLPGLFDLLAPGGILAFSAMAAGSFEEWWEQTRQAGIASGMRRYPDLDTWRRMLPGSHVDGTAYVAPYPNSRAFLTDLKKIGAHVPDEAYRAVGSGGLRRALRLGADGMTVTYQIAFVTAAKNKA